MTNKYNNKVSAVMNRLINSKVQTLIFTVYLNNNNNNKKKE